jgi:hypothetical protein
MAKGVAGRHAKAAPSALRQVLRIKSDRCC